MPLGIYVLLWGGILRLPICPMVYITGLPCPACGMTRAAMLFVRGEFLACWEMHPFFYGVLALVLLAIVFRYLLLKDMNWMKYLVAAVAVAAMVYYVYRMYVYFPVKEPMIYEKQSLAGVFWQKIKKLQVFQ